MSCLGMSEDKDKWESGLTNFGKSLEIMEKHLSDKSWLVGGNLTLADIIVFMKCKLPFAFVMGEE
jgi:glutathione S-transferase